ncbi:MAG: DUF4328 domain-containing protein [Planctomycetota bacterium]
MTQPMTPMPQELGYATGRASAVPAFLPTETRAKWAVVFLYIWVGSTVVQLVTTGMTLFWMTSVFDNPQQRPSAGFFAVMGLTWLASLLHFGIWVTAIVFMCMWLFRSLNNLRSFGREPRLNPGLSVGFWFIPLANLVMPGVIHADLLRKSDRAATGSTGAAWWMMGLMLVSWLLQVGGLVWQQTRAVMTIMRNPPTGNQPPDLSLMFYTPAVALQLSAYPVWIGGLIAMIVVIRQVQRRQADTVRSL